MNTGRTEKEQVRVHIRWMIRRDMPEVLHAEATSFEFAWTEEDFLRCLRQRNCIGMVAEHGEKVVGFMIYELHKTKLHILNFAVHRRAGGAAASARRWSPSSSASSRAIAARGSRWKCARRTCRPSCSSGSRNSGRPRAARLLRRLRRGRVPHGVPLRHRRHARGDGRGDQPHRAVRGELTDPTPGIEALRIPGSLSPGDSQSLIPGVAEHPPPTRSTPRESARRARRRPPDRAAAETASPQGTPSSFGRRRRADRRRRESRAAPPIRRRPGLRATSPSSRTSRNDSSHADARISSATSIARHDHASPARAATPADSVARATR